MQKAIIDLSKNGIIPVFHAKQGDTSRRVAITLLDNGLPYDTAADAVSVWYSGPSGEGNYSDGIEKDGSTLTILVNPNMTAASGRHTCAVMLSNESGRCTTWNFCVEVACTPALGSEEAKAYFEAFEAGELAADIAAVDARTAKAVAELNARVSAIIASGTATEGNTELIDIRTGADGKVYQTAGDAVRGQIGELNGDLVNLSDNGKFVLHPTMERGWIGINGQNEDNYNTLRTVDYIEVSSTEYNLSVTEHHTMTIKTYSSDKTYIRSVYSTDGIDKINLGENEKFIRYAINTIDSQYPVTEDSAWLTYKANIFNKIESDISALESKVTVKGSYYNASTELGTISSGYINKDTGAYVAYDNCYSSDFIDIEALRDAYITARAMYSVAIYCVYNNSKDMLTSLWRESQSILDVERLRFPIDSIKESYPNAKYVRFSSIEKSLSLEKLQYIPVGDKVEELESHINKTYHNPLYGKKIIAIGDSMVYGHTVGTENVWLKKIAERNNMEYVNYGANGSQIAYVATPYHDADYSVYARYSSMVNDADIIIVFAGTNDSNYSITIGSVDSTDNTTVCGALNGILDGLKTKYPDKLVVMFTPYERASSKAKDRTYIDAIVSVCKRNAVPVFNNAELGGINWSNTAQINLLLLDDTHLNANGHLFASKRYEGFIRSLMV